MQSSKWPHFFSAVTPWGQEDGRHQWIGGFRGERKGPSQCQSASKADGGREHWPFIFSWQKKQNHTIKSRLSPRQTKESDVIEVAGVTSKADETIPKLSRPWEGGRQMSGAELEIVLEAPWFLPPCGRVPFRTQLLLPWQTSALGVSSAVRKVAAHPGLTAALCPLPLPSPTLHPNQVWFQCQWRHPLRNTSCVSESRSLVFWMFCWVLPFENL